MDLRQRLIDLGMTGYVEQQQVLQEVAWWLEEKKNTLSTRPDLSYEKYKIMEQFADELLASLNANQESKNQSDKHE